MISLKLKRNSGGCGEKSSKLHNLYQASGRSWLSPWLTFGVVRADVTWGQSWDLPPCQLPAVRPGELPLCQSSFRSLEIRNNITPCWVVWCYSLLELWNAEWCLPCTGAQYVLASSPCLSHSLWGRPEQVYLELCLNSAGVLHKRSYLLSFQFLLGRQLVWGRLGWGGVGK